MPKIEGIKELGHVLARMRDRSRREDNGNCVVGYTQSYALTVHEDLMARHTVGQAKYLEQPARELSGELGKMIAAAKKKGATLNQALLMAGLRLQRESQELVPVDTGALKGSAFTKVEP